MPSPLAHNGRSTWMKNGRNNDDKMVFPIDSAPSIEKFYLPFLTRSFFQPRLKQKVLALSSKLLIWKTAMQKLFRNCVDA